MGKRHEKIVLLGFMGCGKSTVGRAISLHQKKKFIDLDATIEIKQKSSIGKLFESRGEEVFRDIESEALELALGLHSAVISLGGGTPCFNSNMDKLANSASSIYLKLKPEDLADRLFEEKEHRPLIKAFESKKELIDFITNKLSERSKYYMQASYVIDANKCVDDLLEEITYLLDS